MILGIFFRNYKSYSNLHFIPVTDSIKNTFSMYVGLNGVGKSSILEALNAFFNNGYWNKTKGGKQDVTFICPLFLINKEKFKKLSGVRKEHIEVFEIISNSLLNFDKNNLNAKEIRNFFDFRDEFEFDKEKYFLIVAGCTFKEKSKTYFGGTFDTIFRQDLQAKYPDLNINDVLHLVKKYYSYIYIPVESRVDDILKLEALEMQKLMDTNILEKIDEVMSSKELSLKGTANKTSVINIINKTLNDFMNNINEKIKEIDSDYSFKTEDGYKKNLTAIDLRDKVLEAYFSIRTLKKSNKEIYELSSGEQRIALIDMASAFIKQNSIKSTELVLAIDEPESSLHISKCYSQFKRLHDLSLKDETQVLITTHWYGSIPILQNGTLNHIEFDDKAKVKSFALNNYLEDRRAFPDDINLRSFFELVSTIISSSKNEMKNWLIVEGSDDLNYFTYYLKDKITNLTILPVGGIGNVIKIYEYLFSPFAESVEQGILKDAKILCIIDSDISQKTTNFFNKDVQNSLRLQRLQNVNDTITLQSTKNVGEYVQTSIEDCLNPKIFFDAIDLTFAELGEINDFNNYSLNPDVITSKFRSENSLLKPTTLEAYENRENIINRIQSNEFKSKLSSNYCTLASEQKHDTPELFNLVKKFFN